MTVLDVAESLGMADGGIRSDLDLVEAVRHGLPTTVVDAVVRTGILTSDEVDRLVISRRDLAERTERGRPLSPAESDALVRIVRVFVIARENFGETEKAARWLRTPNQGLGGAVPLELLDTGEGARVVEEAILRLAHGIFA